MARPFTVVMIVPTGIGADLGGYAGDALPIARSLSGVCDRLITHPNVLNGAQLYWPIPNALYVEGYALDQMAAGCWGLQPVHSNRVGLLLDRGMEPELQLRHLQAADGARATLGINMTDYVITDAPLNVELRIAPSGASWGTIGNPDSLLRGAKQLIDKAGAEAIAVVARFPDDEGSVALSQYRQGQGVDPLAGAEAIISHLIVRHFRIPCAHAPALLPLPLDPHLSPRSAAEEIGYTFLPCVLAGLSRAPQYVQSRLTAPDSIWANQVDAVVVPETACGGSAILSFANSAKLMITVAENRTTMATPPEAIGIKTVPVKSYLEAIGVLVTWRQGVNHQALRPNLTTLNRLHTP
ncbi:MAG: DUF3326 domain-containing protein [Limnospira sp. PMC 1291.21]|uniref:DUF3326 domain-containing protein n=2 Tax=Limnospira TaxID=2596745 RepID=B5VYZ3_LIMMA|nr:MULTISPECIES: DUF3326 domain-containing protein [Limnospira]EKD10061.1 hypothetical protein SPLC1_S100910 [Arthrospira platensis C1]MDC0837935.1 DUF3326 domain-containing protein [Limnoraphis robusta]MDY7051155.1 DUF3326 domain-containing protein [Limnospira fusiformis LS22]QJB28495.1 DUF3326 domain-containing protein [Limnospira fusiformis SAG 85.79]EDZ95461.1 conserved hypothetical protein [Limnospira maxima CS-328]